MNTPPKHLTPPPAGCELLRENVFGDEEDDCKDDELLKRREPTMLRRGKKLIAPSCGTAKKYTVVFDLDETVVYARDGPLYARAYLKDLLRSIKDAFEVIVWTAGERDYAKNVLEEINEDQIIEHLVYRHRRWFHEDDYTKDLRQLGRDLDRTIMIENTPDCVRANPLNSIIVEDFEVLPPESDTGEDDEAPRPGSSASAPAAPEATDDGMTCDSKRSSQKGEDGRAVPEKDDAAVQKSNLPPRRRASADRTLFLLREVLLGLAKSGDTVPHYLANCSLLTTEVVEGSDGNKIQIYHLGTRRRRSSQKVVKTNRDKAPKELDKKSPPQCARSRDGADGEEARHADGEPPLKSAKTERRSARE